MIDSTTTKCFFVLLFFTFILLLIDKYFVQIFIKLRCGNGHLIFGRISTRAVGIGQNILQIQFSLPHPEDQINEKI